MAAWGRVDDEAEWQGMKSMREDFKSALHNSVKYYRKSFFSTSTQSHKSRRRGLARV